LKTVFSIGSESREGDAVLMEIGQDYCSYAFLDKQSKKFHRIGYISFEETEAEEKLPAILDEIKQHGKHLTLCSAFYQAMLIPDDYPDAGPSLLNACYELPARQYFSDTIQECQAVLAYSFPLPVYNLVRQSFSSVDFFHAYTPALKVYNGFVAADQVDIHFTPRFFRLLVKKGQAVQLVQTYAYKTPLDVIYYLLKICYEFGLNQSEVFVIVSGLIDRDSAMYNELYNYFLNLHFAMAPSFSLPDEGHPPHYFTSLYNLAACVS
jgi:hypothetical protein